LDVAKIEAGSQALELAPCDLTNLVLEVMGMMRERAEAKHLGLFVVQPAEFPRYVRADAPKLRQVLINLLDNAVKYTETGTVGLQLDSRPTGPAGRLLVTFSVDDTGIGIGRADQARIFEAFVQIGKPDSHTGTGLGLTITRQFVELMGGTIQVDSTPREGSRFCVELPLEPAQASETMKPGDDGERVIGVAPGQPEYRILVIDDEGQNRALLQRLLQNAGFQVRVAVDGEQGIEMFRHWEPHFIWMDLRMPVLDGVQATRRIRAMAGGREVKIAAVTASVFVGERSEILAAGMDDLVCKPYRPADVFDCMARHLGVSYRVREVVRGSSLAPAEPLRPEALAALPEDLRMELREAVITLHGERIVGIIGRVLERDPDLGCALAGRAHRLEYTAIFEAIEGCQPKARGRPA
jgi:CheY-like chemotaxis protein